jgi:hypothetical protein
MDIEERSHQTSRDRRVVVQEAGLPRLSFVSILAGALTAYGAFAIVAAIVAALLNAADVDTDFSTNDWASTGAVGGLATGLALLLAYLFGGYVAGRMARRSGLLHGIGVAVLSIVGGGLAGAAVSALADNDQIEENHSSIGVPTTWDEWTAVAVTTTIVAVAAVILGSIAGSVYGERWHTRLLDRAADPETGRSAAARRRAEDLEAERDRLVHHDVQPVPPRSDEMEREEVSRAEVERLRDEGRNVALGDRDDRIDADADADADTTIDLRDDPRPPPPVDAAADEPRYTAAEWEAMRRSSTGSQRRF